MIPPKTPVVLLGEIFSPTQPIEDPATLFGRDNELKDLMVAYGASRDGVPAISGPPGIGKSSLLSVFRQILMGDQSILESRGLGAYAPSRARRLVLTLTCSSSIASQEELSLSILKCVGRAVSEKPDRKDFYLPNFEIHAPFGLGALKGDWKYTIDSGSSTIEALVRALGELLNDDAIDEVFILLDECEQLPWLDDLLEFTRQFHLGDTRFVLAMRDHVAHRLANADSGSYRWPSHVQVRGLPAAQIRDFFSSAGERLHALTIPWRVGGDAFEFICQHSGGEPWYLQMIGDALVFDPAIDLVNHVSVSTSPPVLVAPIDVRAAERYIMERYLPGLHEQRYTDLCQRAPRREEVLRTLASFPGMVVPDRFCWFLAQKRGKGVRRLIRELASRADPVLVPVAGGTSWQFAQHQFRVYCRLVEPFGPTTDTFANLSLDQWSLRS